MNSRLDYKKASPGASRAMAELAAYVRYSGLEPGLLALVDMLASQLNGCAYCLDMHAKEARDAGESEQRLYALPVWRETPFYTERERAALAWTEAVTRLDVGHVSGDVWDEVRQHFGEKEIVDLTLAIVAINGWNRLNVAMRTEPGSYRQRPNDGKTGGDDAS